jgi:hypothetical protein
MSPACLAGDLLVPQWLPTFPPSTDKEEYMSPQDSFSDHAEIVNWISKRGGYTTFEEQASVSAAVPPFEFDDDEGDDDFDWE